jgi:hypothetical protein
MTGSSGGTAGLYDGVDIYRKSFIGNGGTIQRSAAGVITTVAVFAAGVKNENVYRNKQHESCLFHMAMHFIFQNGCKKNKLPVNRKKGKKHRDEYGNAIRFLRPTAME